MTGDPVGIPPRPKNLEPEELGFRRRTPVRWLGPVLLAATGARVALADQFGAYLDKRELQYPFPKLVHDHADGEDLWFDYVADTGDGFNATYSVAYLLGQPSLTVGGETLPRGQVLVLGGDQVYPTASSHAYEDRFTGPFRSAFPWPAEGEPPPALYALPGNHDWYDGLTAFLRLFATREGTTIGGWHTAQNRSYFALRLPKRWWLFAIDAQEGAYIDDPQLEYFREAAAQVQPGDRVIVCTPNPSWVEDSEKGTLYDSTDFFLRKVVAPTGAQVSLMLSGDLHHYARYSNPNRELITFGGGGAYLYATHELPKAITVPPKESIVRTSSPAHDYELATTYPTRLRSRALGTGVFARLPVRNWGFLIMLGVLHTLLLLALDNGEGRVILTLPGFLMVAVVFGLTLFFAAGLNPGRRRPKNYWLGVIHGVVQLGMGVGALLIWRLLPFDTLPWPLPIIAATALYGPILAIAAAEVVALYLLVASRFKVNLNELFAGQGIQGFKGFLRMHIAPDGSLTIYPIGLDGVGKRWRAAPDAEQTAPWIEPVRALKPHLIEAPIRIGRPASAGVAASAGGAAAGSSPAEG